MVLECETRADIVVGVSRVVVVAIDRGISIIGIVIATTISTVRRRIRLFDLSLYI